MKKFLLNKTYNCLIKLRIKYFNELILSISTYNEANILIEAFIMIKRFVWSVKWIGNGVSVQ